MLLHPGITKAPCGSYGDHLEHDDITARQSWHDPS